MVKAQLAQAYRAPGVDGRPLMSDKYLLENIIETEYPDTVQREIDAQLLPATSQKVKKLIDAAREQQWMDDHPDTVALAEKNLGQPISLYPEDIQALAALLQKQMQGAPGLGQMVAQADQLAGGGGLGLPPGQGPAGANPAALPAQLQMTPDQALPEPNQLAASQARRQRPVNSPTE